jgi:hypothetical protein
MLARRLTALSLNGGMAAVAGSQVPEPDEGARRGGSMIGDSMRAGEGIQRLSERTPAQR